MNEKGEIDNNRLSPFDRVTQIKIIYDLFELKNSCCNYLPVINTRCLIINFYYEIYMF